MGLSNRIISRVLANNQVRFAGGRFLRFTGMLSSTLGVDPIVIISLRPLGTNAAFAMHLLKRDTSSLVEVFVNNVYEKFSRISRGDVVVDCGAYIGEFAVRAAQKVGDTGLVLAFEPNPQSLALCRRNVAYNRCANVITFGLALGREKSMACLEVDKTNFGASRVVRQEGKDMIPNIRLEPLDHFERFLEGKAIKLLKIDTEGFAAEIIEGARGLLRKRLIQNIAAEVHCQAEQNLCYTLKDYGFDCTMQGSYLYASLTGGTRLADHAGRRVP